jgi:thioredoxin-related protein
VKKSSVLLSNILIIVLLFSSVFSQNQTASQINSKTSATSKIAPETKKVVTIENIEQDMAEALTVIQDNYVVSGKKLD